MELHQIIALALSVINMVGTLSVGTFVYLSKKNDDTSDKMTDLSERMTKVEANLMHMPTHEEITKVRETLAKVCADNNAQTESLKRLEASQRLITEWMIKNK